MTRFPIAIMFCLSALLISRNAFSQEEFKIDLGMGAGLDYGGFGWRVTAKPSRAVGIFCGLGYAVAGAGFNGGFNANFKPKGRATGYLTAMYGYNAALKMKGDPVMVNGDLLWKKLYYGPSFGLGVKSSNKKKSKNFWNFEILLPIRSAEFKDTLTTIEAQGGKTTTVFPVTLSVGYHLGF
jgi:hypothetical protein